MKKNDIFQKILDSITPEDQARFDANHEAFQKWHDEHPDHSKRYGTDKSYWLEDIKKAGFNPIGITVMICEETIIMETKEEIEAAWEIFNPEGWWYTVDQWEKRRNEYVKNMYDGIEENAPLVYCLDEKYKDIIK